jgi:hypothetical protein
VAGNAEPAGAREASVDDRGSGRIAGLSIQTTNELPACSMFFELACLSLYGM